MEGFVDMNEANSLSWSERNKRNNRHLALWTGVWLVSLALVYFGHRYIWESNQVITSVMVGVNVIAGVVMIFANKRVLQDLDELQLKVQLEAMALSLGAGLVAGFAYSALSATGVLPFEAKIAHLAVFMAVTYLFGVFTGARKYQ